MHPAEEALLRMNVEQLQATAELAEDVNLQLSKAVKFYRFAGNASELLARGEIAAKLGACIRLVKTILPVSRPTTA